jgi:hypothetical protein
MAIHQWKDSPHLFFLGVEGLPPSSGVLHGL